MVFVRVVFYRVIVILSNSKYLGILIFKIELVKLVNLR